MHLIQARRRILAPAHRAASGPTTTAPFPPSNRASLSGLLDPIGRRASMPTADALQLYHPMTLQSMPNSPSHHHHHDYVGGPSRHMLGMSSSRSSHHHVSGLSDYNQGRHSGMGLYVPSGQGGGHGHGHGPSSGSSYLASDVPLSAPPSLSGNPFSSHGGGSHGSSGGQGLYSNMLPSPRASSAGQGYFNDGPSHSGSTSSGYATPQ